MAEIVVDEGVSSIDGRATRAPVQRRGQQRVDEILEAAELVISEVGVEAATMNAIAERSGASVGSLYHFFPNKTAILTAMTARYLESVAGLLQQELRFDQPSLPLEQLFTDMIAAFARMDEAHPGYMAVCRATDAASGGKSPIALATEAHMQSMVEQLLMQRFPGIPPRDAAAMAAVSVVTVHSVLDHALSTRADMRPALRASLVQLMVNYFSPLEALYPLNTPR
jgi:AcrR family transcriptional regulator